MPICSYGWFESSYPAAEVPCWRKTKNLADLFRQAELLEGRKRAIFEEIERERQLGESGNRYWSFGILRLILREWPVKSSDWIVSLKNWMLKSSGLRRYAWSVFRTEKAQIIQQRRDDEERAEIDAKKQNLDEIGIEVLRNDDKG